MTETWGALQLAETHVQLASFDGALTLEPAGVMSASAGSELAGSRVYRVTNADEFFERNKGRNAFCTQPVRWLTVASRSNETSPDGAIWLAMLTLEEWSAYTPEQQGYCGGGLYAPGARAAR